MRPYNDYNSYLRNRYGTKVYKIGIDAGFSCPNRDGTIGRGGCIYCNDRGSRASYADPVKSVSEQLSSRIAYLKDNFGAEKFIAYFQAFTNTHAPVKKLKETYDSVLPFEDIVEISIGTRPDCVDEEKISLISSYKSRYEVWMEYGLQSMRDDTLKFLERGHTFRDFVRAVNLSARGGIKICAHVILGLPGESIEDALKMADVLSDLGINGIKIHLLHVLKGSRMEKMYRENNVELMEQKAYVDTVCSFLENLSPDIVIQRLTGEGDRENHVAPLWALDKTKTLKMIADEFTRRGSKQGSSYTDN